MDLIEKSSPSTNSNLSFINIKERVGWVCITVKNDTSEFLIKYSSCMFDTSCLVRFFEKLISLKEKTVLVLDNEGSLPILYAEPIDNNNVRFIFAHDYNLFLNDDIDEYTIRDYKIECDAIINKKELLKTFYNILYSFTENYNLKDAYNPEFKIEVSKKYLNKINSYIKQAT